MRVRKGEHYAGSVGWIGDVFGRENDRGSSRGLVSGEYLPKKLFGGETKQMEKARGGSEGVSVDPLLLLVES
ncbi:predicted protein [Sclerotinia sclerotiorum 1980 UF-70]|uniref:Uncharacterized protein n=1 Tax=Sclerotinia sclerotiorum (strain ATCC 18683 / 1980 / Ss-1) TaxID=665079 RepID=A7EW81_SCLS1|nr:predicted protein [Sclerotinia sclerotiorum 1980 UF-70]EDN93723.1 predicted protein [Sclerotinia sclerotiorum 1980 UF-70]